MHIKDRPSWACPQNIKENVNSIFISSNSSDLLWIYCCLPHSSSSLSLFTPPPHPILYLFSLHQCFMSAAGIRPRPTWLQLLTANKVLKCPLKRTRAYRDLSILSDFEAKNKLGRRFVLQHCSYKDDRRILNLNDQLRFSSSKHVAIYDHSSPISIPSVR